MRELRNIYINDSNMGILEPRKDSGYYINDSDLGDIHFLVYL